MKYKYNRLIMLFQWLLVFLFIMLLLYLFYLGGQDIAWVRKNFFVGTVFLIVFISTYNKEYLNRYVELNNDFVCFNSFRINKMKSKRILTINVRYEDILSIDATKIPVLGIYKIKIKSKTFIYDIPVSFSFCKHNKLYGEIVERAKQHNPKVYIDERLIKHLEKKGLY